MVNTLDNKMYVFSLKVCLEFNDLTHIMNQFSVQQNFKYISFVFGQLKYFEVTKLTQSINYVCP